MGRWPLSHCIRQAVGTWTAWATIEMSWRTMPSRVFLTLGLDSISDGDEGLRSLMLHRARKRSARPPRRRLGGGLPPPWSETTDALVVGAVTERRRVIRAFPTYSVGTA